MAQNAISSSTLGALRAPLRYGVNLIMKYKIIKKWMNIIHSDPMGLLGWAFCSFTSLSLGAQGAMRAECPSLTSRSLHIPFSSSSRPHSVAWRRHAAVDVGEMTDEEKGMARSVSRSHFIHRVTARRSREKARWEREERVACPRYMEVRHSPP